MWHRLVVAFLLASSVLGRVAPGQETPSMATAVRDSDPGPTPKFTTPPSRSEVLADAEREAAAYPPPSGTPSSAATNDIADVLDLDNPWVTILLAPLTIPKMALDDRSWRQPAYFVSHPYRDGYPGYLQYEFEDRYRQFGWFLRSRLDYTPGPDEANRIGGQLLLDTASRLGLDVGFEHLDVTKEASVDDGLLLGDINFVYRFAQSPQWMWRTGLGLNWMRDDAGFEEGFNFTYGADWFPRKPWILSSELDWGRLGEAPLLHLRGTVGVQFHRTELFTGYDYFSVSELEAHGIVAGLRLWY